ncbi:hypothetical protein FB45DRAFT_1007520 [Roridomyces roridus]|uniref:Uncharacterized protein n=1 Tax=Roridomyces roridus TaxID=1738132 RepID=A0AAD7FFS1_9AGAR|nr:hypothetical protein FB45DRAFT_1007520 [Roridomyces roridus]
MQEADTFCYGVCFRLHGSWFAKSTANPSGTDVGQGGRSVRMIDRGPQFRKNGHWPLHTPVRAILGGTHINRRRHDPHQTSRPAARVAAVLKRIPTASASGSWDNRKTEKPKNRDSGDGGVLPFGTNTSDHLLTPDSLDDTRPVVSACARAYPPDARPLSPARRTRRPSSSLHRENGRRPRSDDIIIEAAIFQDPQAHDSHWKTGGTIAELREELGRIETVMARLTRTPHPLYIQGPQPFVHHIPNLHAPQGLLHFPFTSLTLIDVVAGPAVALFKDTSAACPPQCSSRPICSSWVRPALPSPPPLCQVGVLNLQLPPFGCLTPLTVDTTYNVTLLILNEYYMVSSMDWPRERRSEWDHRAWNGPRCSGKFNGAGFGISIYIRHWSGWCSSMDGHSWVLGYLAPNVERRRTQCNWVRKKCFTFATNHRLRLGSNEVSAGSLLALFAGWRLKDPEKSPQTRCPSEKTLDTPTQNAEKSTPPLQFQITAGSARTRSQTLETIEDYKKSSTTGISSDSARTMSRVPVRTHDHRDKVECIEFIPRAANHYQASHKVDVTARAGEQSTAGEGSSSSGTRTDTDRRSAGSSRSAKVVRKHKYHVWVCKLSAPRAERSGKELNAGSWSRIVVTRRKLDTDGVVGGEVHEVSSRGDVIPELRVKTIPPMGPIPEKSALAMPRGR